MMIRFIVNPNAGRRRAIIRVIGIIETVFSAAGHRYDLRFTGSRGHATSLAGEAVEEGCDLVVAVGGDGTVNEIGGALVGSEVALGIIPAGSGNGLARELGIPLCTSKACQTLLQGKARQMDVGVANGRCFFMAAGVGFDALVTKRFNERPNSRRGMLPYFYIAAKEAFTFRPERTVVRIDGRELVLEPFMITAANARQLGGSAVIAPRAQIDDGLFDVCIVRNLNAWQFFCQAPRLFNGQTEKIPQLEVFRTDELEIERKNASPFQVDGEPIEAGSKLSINLLPRALKVWVPAVPACGRIPARGGSTTCDANRAGLMNQAPTNRAGKEA